MYAVRPSCWGGWDHLRHFQPRLLYLPELKKMLVVWQEQVLSISTISIVYKYLCKLNGRNRFDWKLNFIFLFAASN